MAENEEGKKTGPEKDDDAVGPPPKRVRLTSSEVKELSRDELATRWKDLNKYVEHLETKQPTQTSSSELAGLRESEEKLKHQQQESTRRENVLVMRLATKEHEMQELLTQIHDLKQAQNTSSVQLRSTLLDPAVNLLFQRMKTELDESKEKLEQAQNDLSAWKFTPDSVTGKKLMAKCRMLIQENQELGRQLSQGRVAQLEAELALQKKYSDELKTSQDELNDFVIQLDEEVEGMQSTILTLQQQLKDSRQQAGKCSELSEQLKQQLQDTEKMLQEARLQIAQDSSTAQDSQAHEQTPPEAEVQQSSENANEASAVSDSQERILSPSDGTVKPRSGALSAFSISNLLATDSHKTEEAQAAHARKRENGEQREDSDSGGALIEPSSPRLSTPKGLAEGIGENVATLNGEVVG